MTRLRRVWLTSAVAAVAAVAAAAGFAAGHWLWPAPLAVRSFLEARPAFLVDHPEFLERARPIAEQRRAAEVRARRRAAVEAAWPRYLGMSTTPRLGRPTDPIVVVEFTDYGCIPCKNSSERVSFLAASNPDTQFVLAYLPGADSGSELAARTAIAVWTNAPHRFQEVHRALMDASVDGLTALVDRLLSTDDPGNEAILQEIASGRVRQQLAAARELASTLDIRGIPSFVVDGRVLTGPVLSAELQRAIDASRAARSSTRNVAQ